MGLASAGNGPSERMNRAGMGNQPGVRALVTNDDGVHSEGLRALARAARAQGLEVMIVAPAFDASGSSASMTAMASDGRVLVDTVSSDGDGAVLGVQGPPAFIVRAAIYGAFGPAPDLVLSGVNRGLNTGRAVLHSGTVGAVLTASNYGRRGLALSADVEDDDSWDPDPGIVASAVRWIVNAPDSTVLNVNMPKGSHHSRPDARSTSLAETGTVQGSVSEVTGGFVPVTFADEGRPPEPGTDAAALAEGFVSVTAVRGVTEDSSIDLPALLRLAPASGW